MLTAPQKTQLKAYIDASSDLTVYPNTIAGNTEIARLLNLDAAPPFIVWKSIVPIGDVGRAFDAAELAGLTAINHTRLQTLAIYLAGGVTPGLASVRAFFDDIFSGAGGTKTRAALLVLWKRAATRGETVFATGTGTEATPGTLVVEGALSVTDVEEARNS